MPQSNPSPENPAEPLTISVDTVNGLRRIAERQNISLSEALRQAVSVNLLLVDANLDPNTCILLKKGRQIDELKLTPGARP